MFRSCAHVGSVPALVLALALVSPNGRSAALGQTPGPADETRLARLGREWVKNNPPGRSEAQAHPQVKDNMYPEVSPDEREALGLPAPTWVPTHGKVQPAVREALEEQRRLIDSGDPMVAFQGDRPAGFQGMAYVDVYLRHEPKGEPGSKDRQAAIREVQESILSKLTAAEFSLFFAFQRTAGLVGYTDESGLAKLVDDPAVVAVGLDDQARPEDPPIAMHEELPAPPPHRPGERSAPQPPIEKIGKVEAAVYKALEKSADGYVFVIVTVTRVDWQSTGVEKGDAIGKEFQCGVLSVLTSGQFKARSRGATGAFGGYVDGAGLGKLAKHPDVRAVGLNAPVSFLEKRSADGKHWTP